MVLSEADAEARLAALRREREALDRAITDLTLYLELGRRLTVASSAADQSGFGAGQSARQGAHEGVREDDPATFSTAPTSGWIATPAQRPEATQEVRRSAAQPPGPIPSSPGERAGAAGPMAAAGAGSGTAESPDDGRETKSAPDTIPEGALARRYGRALIREAVAVLAEAGRPLHASEILSALTARGFSVPGQQDPVAALNTRLWKRSGPGGLVRRLGDALYAPAQDAGGMNEADGADG